jgi:type IV secretory pathway VirB4 component
MTKSKSAQNFVPIKEIRDGVLVLKDNSYRGIIMASSLNFALKSREEQTSILLQFQNFLNSLDFPVQFFIQSRKLDIRPYVSLLETRYTEQKNDLMKIQTREYIDFIKSFTESSNIMSKNFFVVIPYSPSVISKGGGKLSSLIGKKKTKEEFFEEKSALFEQNKTQLDQRIAVAKQGLIRSGIRTVRLGTEELVELFFKIFNPGESEKPILKK